MTTTALPTPVERLDALLKDYETADAWHALDRLAEHVYELENALNNAAQGVEDYAREVNSVLTEEQREDLEDQGGPPLVEWTPVTVVQDEIERLRDHLDRS